MFGSGFLHAVFHFHPLGAVVVAAACFALLRALRHIFRDIQHAPEDQTFTLAGSWAESEKKLGTTEPPYPADFFPGHRQVNTAFGKIQVFEWGPAEGEKVLLVHGLSTPCIALRNMANEFVDNGYRVMIFGECQKPSCCSIKRGISIPPIFTNSVVQTFSEEATRMRRTI